MAMTGSQIARVNAALGPARANVAAAEAKYGSALLFPTPDQSRTAAMRETLDSIEQIYASALDDSTPIVSDSVIDDIVKNANDLTPDFVSQLAKDAPTVGDVIGTGALSVFSDLKWIVLGGLALVLAVEILPTVMRARK